MEPPTSSSSSCRRVWVLSGTLAIKSSILIGHGPPGLVKGFVEPGSNACHQEICHRRHKPKPECTSWKTTKWEQCPSWPGLLSWIWWDNYKWMNVHKRAASWTRWLVGVCAVLYGYPAYCSIYCHFLIMARTLATAWV